MLWASVPFFILIVNQTEEIRKLFFSPVPPITRVLFTCLAGNVNYKFDFSELCFPRISVTSVFQCFRGVYREFHEQNCHHYPSFCPRYLLSLPPWDEIRISVFIAYGLIPAKLMLLDLVNCSGPVQHCKVPLIFLINTSSDVPAAVLKWPEQGDNSFIRGRTWFHLLLSGWCTELEMLLCFPFSSQWLPHLLMKCTYLPPLFMGNKTVGKQSSLFCVLLCTCSMDYDGKILFTNCSTLGNENLEFCVGKRMESQWNSPVKYWVSYLTNSEFPLSCAVLSLYWQLWVQSLTKRYPEAAPREVQVGHEQDFLHWRGGQALQGAAQGLGGVTSLEQCEKPVDVVLSSLL